MVDELVEARTAQGEQPDAATTIVLNQLGDPRQLARQYDSGHRYLIGPKHYDEYIALLKVLVTRALPLAAIVTFAINLISGEGEIGTLIGGAVADSIWTILTVGVQIVFWVTVVFAIMERSVRSGGDESEGNGDSWTVADLPKVNQERQISMVDALTGLGFTVSIGAILILVYRNGINMYLGDERSAQLDRTVPFFNPDLPAALPLLVMGLLVIDALVDVLKYAVGYWTRVVAFTQIALNVVWVLAGLVVIGGWELVNPGVRSVVNDDAAELLLGSWFEQSILAAVIVFAAIAIWEAVRGHLAWRTGDDRQSV